MQVDRLDFLKRLLAVSVGLTPAETIQQSTCVVFHNGRFYTQNREVACSIASNLDFNFHCAVPGRELINLLKKLTEEVIQVELEHGRLLIGGKNREAKLAVHMEVVLPFASVELPKKKTWVPIHPEFGEAIDLVSRCTVKKSMVIGHMCVHLCPTHMEASDNKKMGRWVITTPVPSSVLIRGVTLRTIIPLGMTKGAMTKNWLHFKNGFGLRVSCRQYPVDRYVNLDQFLSIRGERIIFPKAIADAADRAGLMLDETDGSIKVSISNKRITLVGEGMVGEYTERKKIDYEGKDMSFFIPPKLITELVDKDSACEVNTHCLRVATEQYTYLTGLLVINEKQEMAGDNLPPASATEEPDEEDIPF